jgi:hypothetical protein
MAVYPGPPTKQIRLIADRQVIETPATVAKKKMPVKVVSKNNYILLAATNQGMHFQVVAPGKLGLLTPPSHIKAQLIKRGEVPELITEGVELEFSVLDPQPKLHTPGYWSELKKYFKYLSAPKGKLRFNPEAGVFESAPLVLEPFDQGGGTRPFPAFGITAKDVASGKVLVSTVLTTAVSAEMGCGQCHGGGSALNGGGLSAATVEDMMQKHDRKMRSNLLKRSQTEQIFCQECHGDPSMGQEGDPKLLNVSAAIHGLHAVYLSDKEEDACLSCHPTNAEGEPRSLRGIHARVEVTCFDCHGYLEDHAAALLKKEAEAGKPGAKTLLALLKPRKVESLDEVNPRRPWVNEPDCLSCHVDFAVPSEADAYNQWTESKAELYHNRKGETGSVGCISCHGSPHALYPTLSNKDSAQPVQYQNNPYPMGANLKCTVCHTVDMDDEAHHANSLRMMRNTVD